MMKKRKMLGLLLCMMCMAASGAKVQKLTSPNGKLEVTVTTDGQRLTWAVNKGETQVLTPSAIQAVVDGQPLISGQGSVARKQQVTSSIATPVYRKQQVADNYGMLVMKFAHGTTVEFRAYDDGAAYRIGIGNAKASRIDSETAEFRFAVIKLKGQAVRSLVHALKKRVAERDHGTSGFCVDIISLFVNQGIPVV